MSRLIETIRVYNGRIENRDYHLRRIHRSSEQVFGSLPLWNPSSFLSSLPVPPQGLHKLRLVYDPTDITYSVDLYTIRPIRTLRMVNNDHIRYDHKYEDRKELEGMSSYREDCDEVLIVKNGYITDVSYANIIFRKGPVWYTPDTFLLNGTMRQQLLDRGVIREVPIRPEDLPSYEEFRLVNAMVGLDAPASDVSNIR